MDTTREARQLARIFEERPADLAELLGRQLDVLKGQAQMLLGLSGLAITVTGFSGHHMVAAGQLPSVAMILGILSILVSTVLTLRVMARVRWVTQELGDDLEATALTMIRHRDAQQRRLSVAGWFVGVGLAGYLLAVVLAALSAGGAM